MKYSHSKRGLSRVFSLLMAVLMIATFMVPGSASPFDDLASVSDLTDHGESSSASSADEPIEESSESSSQPEEPTDSGNQSDDASSSAQESKTEEETEVATSGTTPALGASGDEWGEIPDDYVVNTGSSSGGGMRLFAWNDTSNQIYHITDKTIQHKYPFSGGTSMMPAYIFYTADGRAAYCIEPARFNSYYGTIVTGSTSFSSLSASKQSEIALAVFANTSGTSNHADYMATQAIIWEICMGQKHKSGSVYAAVITANSAALSAAYDSILSKMESLSEVPSFMSADKSSPTIHQMEDGGGTWSIELTNTNSNVSMSAGDFKSKAPLDFSVSGDKLTVTTSIEPDADSFVEWHGGGDGSGLVFWNSDVQAKTSQAENASAPSSGYMAFDAEAAETGEPPEEEEPKRGYLTIYKYDGESNLPLGGAVFRIECDGFVDEGFSVPYGGATIVIPIPKGETSVGVTVTEVTAPNLYIGDPEPKRVTVTADEIVNIAEVSFVNYPQACSLTIYKYEKGSYGKPLAGARFRIRYADANVSAQVWELTTDASGTIKIDLPHAGTLVVEEARLVLGQSA